jgi:hypothetical protein
VSAFKDLEIEWGGSVYKVEAGRRFALICALEEHVTLGEIGLMAADPSRMNASALARGFAAILRFVGVTEVRDGKTAPVSGEAVYGQLFGGAPDPAKAMAAVRTLLAIVEPDGVAKPEPI